MPQLFGLARIGRDCELRYTGDGKAVTNVSLAFNYGKKQDGKRPTQWVEGVLWERRAESLVPYLLKGGMVSVTLFDVHIESFDNKGTPRHKLVGIISEIELAGGKTHLPRRANRPSQHRSLRRTSVTWTTTCHFDRMTT